MIMVVRDHKTLCDSEELPDASLYSALRVSSQSDFPIMFALKFQRFVESVYIHIYYSPVADARKSYICLKIDGRVR